MKTRTIIETIRGQVRLRWGLGLDSIVGDVPSINSSTLRETSFSIGIISTLPSFPVPGFSLSRLVGKLVGRSLNILITREFF